VALAKLELERELGVAYLRREKGERSLEKEWGAGL
jgi:hypothetical protein